MQVFERRVIGYSSGSTSSRKEPGAEAEGRCPGSTGHPAARRPERPREPAPRVGPTAEETLAALQAATMVDALFPQGIGLRPQPWAKFSRPVGPGGSTIASSSIYPRRSLFLSKAAFIWMSLLVRSGGRGKSRTRTPWHRPLERIESEPCATGGSILYSKRGTKRASRSISARRRNSMTLSRRTIVP